jgi:diguanylate cyclase (GGDEF)-like protein/PAS domain S-box-containing protein
VSDVVIGLAGLRKLYELIGALNRERSLDATLTRVVDGVIAGLGFGVAVVNVVQPDGSFQTVAVAGSADARQALMGSRAAADAFDLEFALAERWGSLRFVPHERLPAGPVTGWVPPAAAIATAGEGGESDVWHPLDALFAPLHAPSGRLVGMLSVDLPVDGRRPGPLQRELLEMFAGQAGIAIDNASLTEQLYASEEAFRLAFEGAGTGMSMVSLDPAEPGRYLRVNDAMCAITGYTAAELMSRTVADITHPDDLQADLAGLAGATTGMPRYVYRTEKRYIRADRSTVWVSITSSPVCTSTGRMLYGITQVEDISTRKAMEADLRHQAAHDPLTGLANRATLTDRLTKAIDRVQVRGEAGAVLFCDLDGFKAVNDRHGHDVGDQVLQVVAARLAEQVRPGELVARLGGDEFVVIAERISPSEADRLAARLEEAVAAPIVVDAVTVVLSVSVGAAVLTSGATPSALLRTADLAMFSVKNARRTGGPISLRGAPTTSDRELATFPSALGPHGICS